MVDQECQYRERDEKRRPLQREYALCLEERVAWLESLVMDIKCASPEGREVILDSISFSDHLHLGQRRLMQQSHPGGETDAMRLQPKLELDLEGSLIYHGPTSICRIRPSENISGQLPPPIFHGTESEYRQVTEYFGINPKDEIVTEALILFFKWQYPFFMFIYREAFLRDHFGDHSNCKYWSLSLMLAICAIGVLMRPNADSKEMSGRFSAAAESIVLVSGLSQPSITTVQALLCLSFYEIGRGNLSKGWAYSGRRICQKLKFTGCG